MKFIFALIKLFVLLIKGIGLLLKALIYPFLLLLKVPKSIGVLVENYPAAANVTLVAGVAVLCVYAIFKMYGDELL